MATYLPRIADRTLDKKLESKGAVLIVGPKWCGKTTTAKRHAKSVIAIDRPDMTEQYQNLAQLNPSLLLEGEVPRLIDEWQIVPQLWNAVRYEVDQRDRFGQFILTGSAVPPTLDASTHTGIGRIVRMIMRPMSLFESGESDGSVSLADLFAGQSIVGKSSMDLREIAFLLCRGGWPKAIALPEHIALRQAFDYVDAVVSEDISRVDGVRRDKKRTQRLLRSYARHVATQASLETIRQDVIASDHSSFDSSTLYSYLRALKDIFVIEDIPAWNPHLRSKTAIRTADTHYMVDPSLATAALGMSPDECIADLNTMGLLFENLCMRDLRVYAEALDAELYHYRDKSGLECDAVLRLRNGSYGLIEVKLGGAAAIEAGAASLQKLARTIDTTKTKAPAFMMVLCAVTPYAYRRKDGVIVAPISCLQP